MKNKKPDNIVFTEENGYHANLLPFATNVGAPVIKVDDIVSWKSRGIQNVNKQLEHKFNELKLQYHSLMQEYKCNELLYSARFSFEPVIGETYYLYPAKDGTNFLSLIARHEWNKAALGTFKLNSDKKWIVINQEHNIFFN